VEVLIPNRPVLLIFDLVPWLFIAKCAIG